MTTQADWTENLPHTKGATGMTYNTLKLDQQLEFVEFLKNHSYPDGTSIKTIADDATKDLGFVVTENNVRTTAKAAKIELPAARAPKVDPMDALLARIDALERHTAAMQATINAMYPIGSTPYSPQLFGRVTCNTDEQPFIEGWPAGSDQPPA